MNDRTSFNYSVGDRKVAIIGVGFVGASIAYALAIRNIAREIVLIDQNTVKAQGEALDIQHGIPYMGISTVYAGGYEDCANCDLIIICAGRNRQAEESRLDLAANNSKVMRQVVDAILPHYTRGAIMVVSNPVDILTYQVSEWMNLPNGRVFGTGCILDTSRLTTRIADYVSLNTDVVKGFVVGEHGDAQIPIWSKLSIAGVSMDEYCASAGLPWGEAEQTEISNSVKTMGGRIIGAKGKTHYGIATCVCYLADAVLNQRLTIASVSTPFQNEYGVTGVSLSIPSIVGVNGVERRLVERWSDGEYSAFRASAEKLKEFMDSLS